MASASTPGGATYAYGFDANTNRTSGPEGTHTVNSGDQLTDTGFSYNADGNLTAGGSHSALTYNGIGQTASITTGGATSGYSYAGGGQTERTAAGPTTALHSLLGLVTETTAGAGSSYIREASGALIAERTPVGDFYYVRDGQGSVIALVDPAGTQRAAYTYDPYGDHATAAGVNGALPPNPWRWNASYLDADGLYKMGARYYDPGLGRFTQTDPVAGGSCNGYDYACGDPINSSDLDGSSTRKCDSAFSGTSETELCLVVVGKGLLVDNVRLTVARVSCGCSSRSRQYVIDYTLTEPDGTTVPLQYGPRSLGGTDLWTNEVQGVAGYYPEGTKICAVLKEVTSSPVRGRPKRASYKVVATPECAVIHR